MFDPNADPEAGGATPAKTRAGLESDRRCPWCGETNLGRHKRMPNPLGPGILAYLFFPLAITLWLGTPTYNVCPKCGGRWQRGVHFEPANDAPATQPRAGMYAEQVPSAAVVRRRTRIEPSVAAAVGEAPDVELRAPAGSCRTCRQAAGRYDARDAPGIPVAGCTCDGGCKCEVVPADAA